MKCNLFPFFCYSLWSGGGGGCGAGGGGEISGRVRALNLTVLLGSGRVGSDDLGYGPGSGFSFEPVQTSNPNWTSHDRPNIVMLMSDAFVSHPFYTIINFLTVTVYLFFSHYAELMVSKPRKLTNVNYKAKAFRQLRRFYDIKLLSDFCFLATEGWQVNFFSRQ